MSIESPSNQFPINPAKITIDKADFKKSSPKNKKRSTYNFVNAMLFKPYFDLVISKNEELELPYSFIPNIQQYTFYIKLVDALKWLCDNLDADKREPYLLLKATHKVSPERGGIVLRRKPGMGVIDISKIVRTPSGANVPSITSIQEHTATGEVVGNGGEVQQNLIEKTWKDAITEWINAEGNEGNVKVFQFDSITLEEKEWVANVCGDGVEYLFKDNELRMIKPI